MERCVENEIHWSKLFSNKYGELDEKEKKRSKVRSWAEFLSQVERKQRLHGARERLPRMPAFCMLQPEPQEMTQALSRATGEHTREHMVE